MAGVIQDKNLAGSSYVLSTPALGGSGCAASAQNGFSVTDIRSRGQSIHHRVLERFLPLPPCSLVFIDKYSQPWILTALDLPALVWRFPAVASTPLCLSFRIGSRTIFHPQHRVPAAWVVIDHDSRSYRSPVSPVSSSVIVLLWSICHTPLPAAVHSPSPCMHCN